MSITKFFEAYSVRSLRITAAIFFVFAIAITAARTESHAIKMHKFAASADQSITSASTTIENAAKTTAAALPTATTPTTTATIPTSTLPTASDAATTKPAVEANSKSVTESSTVQAYTSNFVDFAKSSQGRACMIAFWVIGGVMGLASFADRDLIANYSPSFKGHPVTHAVYHEIPQTA